MDSKQYSQESGATDLREYSPIQARLNDELTAKLTHYALGLGTEVGEIQDALKKYVAYGKPVDLVNLVEEAGDVLWYLSRLLEACGSSFDEAFFKNNAKLKARYGEKFSEHAALNRDLKAERAILEANVSGDPNG